jgi:GT2 family glycosyltransferase
MRKEKVEITASIVVYDTPFKIIERCLNSFLSSEVDKIFLIDSSLEGLFDFVRGFDSRLVYIKTENIGFGAANNIALKEALKTGAKYHIVSNPDVYFNCNTISELYEFMEKNRDVGLVSPKVLFPDGRLQFSCRLLPSPVNLFMRKFLDFGPFRKVVDAKNRTYELRFTGYNTIMDVPSVSGCFMFLRTSVLKRTGLFDERFFLYLEDVDLSRRINKVARVVYYPHVHIYHEWNRSSYKNTKLLVVHLISGFRYFNKWGWFFDRERQRINRDTINKLLQR